MVSVSSRKLRLLGCGFIVVVAAVAIGYENRRTTADDPTLGRVRTRYCWGRICGFDVDRNRDGRFDGKETFDPPLASWDLVLSVPPTLSLADQDFDGRFELEVKADPSGEVVSVGIDTNGDGTYDKVLTGEEEKTYMKSVVLPRNREIFEKYTKPSRRH